MYNKGDFLNPDEQHKLTQQECDLISIYRVLNESQKESIFRTLFMYAMHFVELDEITAN